MLELQQIQRGEKENMKGVILTYMGGNNMFFTVEQLLKPGKINKLNVIEKGGDESLITLESLGMVISFIID